MRPLVIDPATGNVLPVSTNGHPLNFPASTLLDGSPFLTQALGDARYSLLGHTHSFASLTGRPTTIAGYGITDFNALGDARWSLLAHVHTFASLTSKPTTIAGYGITDFNSLGDARWQPLDSDLTSWAAITRAAGFDAFVATPTLANLKATVTDETTVGWNLLTLANPSAISFLQLNADNTVTAQTALAQRTALSLLIGTNVQAWDADLDALAAFSSTGLAARTGTNTWAQRTLTGTANEITVANGDGASGNPTFSLPSSLNFASKTVTGNHTLSGQIDFTGLVGGLIGQINVKAPGTGSAPQKGQAAINFQNLTTGAGYFIGHDLGGDGAHNFFWYDRLKGESPIYMDGSGAKNALYLQSATPLGLTAPGNVIIGATSDDATNKLQLTGGFKLSGVIIAGSAPTTLTDSAGKILSAALNTVGVAQGGTGATTLAAHGLVVGNGTSPVAVTGAGTAGQVLTSNGPSADPTFQTQATAPVPKVLATVNVDFNAGSTPQLLYSAPGNRIPIVTSVIFRKFSGPGSTAGANIEDQFANRFTGDGVLLGNNPVDVDQALVINPGNGSGKNELKMPVPAALGTEVYLIVTSDEGTALSAKCDVIGYLTDVTGNPVGNVLAAP